MSDTGLADLTWRDIISSAVVAIVVALLLRVFVIGAFEVPSHSMEETLLPGDFIMVNKLAYRLRNVRRGDVVIFTRQMQDSTAREAYVKRVIGLPQDTVILTHEGVWVNGRPLPDPPLAKLPADPILSTQTSPVITIVGTDSLFVLGDNRRNSYDSRYWGCVPVNDVIGTPMMIYWSHGASMQNPLPHNRWDRIFTMIN